MNILLIVLFIIVSILAIGFWQDRQEYNKSKGKCLEVDWGYPYLKIMDVQWVAFDELKPYRQYWGFTSKPTMSHGTWIGEGKAYIGSQRSGEPSEILYSPRALKWSDSLIERPKP